MSADGTVFPIPPPPPGDDIPLAASPEDELTYIDEDGEAHLFFILNVGTLNDDKFVLG